MKNLFDYLEYYGNDSLYIESFNDVDSLVLASLAYGKWEGIIPSGKSKSITLEEACELYIEKYKNANLKKEDWLFPKTYKMIKQLKDCKRYNLARIYNWQEIVSKECQFAAMTIRLDNGLTYISYKGTDSSVIGWQEDFELTYKYPIPSQTEARNYINKTLTILDRKVMLGGHSKGGNLAMYAYLNIDPRYRNRIKKVYNFDGPGFLKDVYESIYFKEMIPKLVMYVPEESVFGMLLYNGPYKVTKSSNSGVMAHEGYSWEVFGTKLTKGTIKSKSTRLHKNVLSFLSKMTIEEKKDFINDMFSFFSAMDVTNMLQLKQVTLSKITTASKKIIKSSPENKKKLISMLKLLFLGIE